MGILALGISTFIGNAEFGAEVERRSFSKTEPNEFGFTRLVKRPSKKTTRQTVESPKSLTEYLYNLSEEIDGVPSIWATVDDDDDGFFPAFVLHGIADEFVINAANPKKQK